MRIRVGVRRKGIRKQLWVAHQERHKFTLKNTKREFEKGIATVKVSAGDVKTTKKTRSRDLLKIQIVMGTFLELLGAIIKRTY